jgi:hypothetical protein
MQSIKIGKRTYQVLEEIEAAEIQQSYPGLARVGCVRLITAQCGKTTYSIHQRIDGSYTKPSAV